MLNLCQKKRYRLTSKKGDLLTSKPRNIFYFYFVVVVVVAAAVVVVVGV